MNPRWLHTNDQVKPCYQPLVSLYAQVQTIFNSALYHFKAGQFSEAAAQLVQLTDDSSVSPAIRLAAFHNLGCIRSAESKPNTAALMLSSAVQLGKEGHGESSLPSLYLAGLQHLKLGHYLVASECLTATVPAFKDKPAVWLRLTECCIGLHQQGGASHAQTTPGGFDGPENSSALTAEEAAHVDVKKSVPRLDMAAAEVYAKTGADLLAAAAAAKNKGDYARVDKEEQLLQEQLDFCLCYLHLAAGRAQQALDLAQELIQGASNPQVVGAAYNHAAEALMMLNQRQRSIEMLNLGLKQLAIGSPEDAALRSCLQTNLAAVQGG